MKTEKPPVLRKKQISEAINKSDKANDEFWMPADSLAIVVQAQRDADAAYYEPLIQQAKAEVFEEMLTAELLEIGRKAIEDILVELRDSRISMLPRNNGLVIREKDGTDSSIIRLGPEVALRIGIEAIRQSLKAQYLKETKEQDRGEE